jgi:hypothetical protein
LRPEENGKAVLKKYLGRRTMAARQETNKDEFPMTTMKVERGSLFLNSAGAVS